ncbi:MAG: 3-(3-hydroxy-phenyl)propionate hydroxylase [Halieaceae bacterium]|jgi:3-(3-hydroxy-phenyl)propionate hydroxylase
MEAVHNSDSRSTAIDVAPVVIAGAGPVGCTLALLLAQQGVPVTLLESGTELPQDLRASTFHPPSLDMLDALGVTEKLLAVGLKVHDYQYRDRRTNEVAKFYLKDLGDETNHHYRLQCEQFKMTRIVVEMLKDYDCAEVIFDAQVAGYREDDDGIDVLTFTGGDEKRYRGSFLIGCDGANSRVRQAGGVMYEGLTYPELFLVASTSFPFEEHFENLSWVNYVSDPDEWCVMLKTLDFWRVLIPAPLDTDRDTLLSDEFIQARLQNLVAKDGDYDIQHRTLYRVHQRVAETYRVSARVVLAGDSAHINNPLGGMGMNGGLHDAFNLGDKLLKILKENQAMEPLLDLYDRQRRQICIDFVQAHTMRNKKLMESTDEAVQRSRQNEFLRMANDPDLAHEFLVRTSMIDSLKESLKIT